MKLNRTYYKHLLRSVLIVVLGLGIIVKESYPVGTVSDNFFILILAILSLFFLILGIIVIIMRYDKTRVRRKFVYSFLAVANFFIGGLSIYYSILHTPGILSGALYLFSLLTGFGMLWDIFFGKRDPNRFEREILID